MNSTLADSADVNNGRSAYSSWNHAFSKAEGIAWCTAYMLASIFIVVGNLLTIAVFVLTKNRFRKKSLFLVINMAFADLMLGAVSLPVYIYIIGVDHFGLWEGTMNWLLHLFYIIVDTVFLQASTISAMLMAGERFYAVYWPLKHRALSTRTYRTVIVAAWITALVVSLVYLAFLRFMSQRHAIYTWIPYAVIVASTICGCNIGVWRKFRQGRLVWQNQNRVMQNQRLTKTLLLVSVLSLLSWLPLSIVIFFIVSVEHIASGTFTIYYITVLLNYSNSFVNPVVYALRIPEFKQVMGMYCLRRPNARSMMNMTKINTEGRSSRASAVTLTSMVVAVENAPNQLAFEQEIENSKLQQTRI